MTTDLKKAIVLFAHGSRDPLWHRPIQDVAACIIANDPKAIVECAYLELSSPDLHTTSSKLIESGVQSIHITPMFLGVGKHAREDLPELVHNLREQFPSVQFHLQRAVGEDERLINLLALIAAESVSTSIP